MELQSKAGIRPFIIYTWFVLYGVMGGWSLSQLTEDKMQGSSWTGHQSITRTADRQTDSDTHTLTHSQFRISISFNCGNNRHRKNSTQKGSRQDSKPGPSSCEVHNYSHNCVGPCVGWRDSVQKYKVSFTPQYSRTSMSFHLTICLLHEGGYYK